VLDWFTDRDTEWIYLIQGSQTSKTTTMLGLLLYAARYDPSPAMWIAAVEEEADKFVVQRLKPFLEAADPDTRTSRKRDWRKADMRIYGKMLTHFAWATSGRKIRSWPCRYLFGDEIGIWPDRLADIGDPIAYSMKRTRRYRNRKGIFASTPSTDIHPSWMHASRSNFGRWYVPCPRCEWYQFLDFHRIRFDHCRRGDGWDLAAIAADTFYECEQCKGRVENREKAAMIAAGRVEWTDPETRQVRSYEPANSAKTLQIPSTYSLFTPWGHLAALFLKHKHSGSLRMFVNDELAEPFRERGADAPSLEQIRSCVDSDREPGAVPEETLAITAGVDVQRDRLYYVVRAWLPEGRSTLIRYGMLPRDPDGGMSALDPVLRTDYDGRPVDHAFIDSGFDPEAVYSYCRASESVSPSKGASGHLAELVKGSPIDRNQGRAVRGGLVLYVVNSAHFKGQIHGRLHVRRGDPREWRLHAETDDNYLRQILSESLVETTRGGRTIREWKVIDKAAGNHYLDAEVLAAACAWYPVAVHRQEHTEVVTDYFERMRKK
jgi:phage terminase large subunit GpA-like protein